MSEEESEDGVAGEGVGVELMETDPALDDGEKPVPYRDLVGKPISGKIVVLAIFVIIVSVVGIAKVWLGPAQKKLNAVYGKQKRMDSCLAEIRSNRLLSAKAKDDFCKKQAAKRSSKDGQSKPGMPAVRTSNGLAPVATPASAAPEPTP